MMSARCLCLLLLLLSIAERNVILSDDRVYHTSKQQTLLEKLNPRSRDMHQQPGYARSRIHKRNEEWYETMYYNIMRTCWAEEPEGRPTFNNLCSQLGTDHHYDVNYYDVNQLKS